jgi:hypothetical protein
MRKIKHIKIISNFIIRCEFDNGEIRDLDLTTFMDKNERYASKVFDENVFKSVQVGELGQLYWAGIAEMKSLEGDVIPIEYDICPDFAYMKSVALSKTQLS